MILMGEVRVKISIAEFNKIKEQLQDIWSKALNGESFSFVSSEEEDYEARVMDEIVKIQDKLLVYDLSGIPFEAWDNLNLIYDDEHKLDFSGTRANIDCAIFGGDSGFDPEYINCKNCQIKNLSSVILPNRREEYFDEEVVRENQNLFLPSTLPLEFKEKCYNFDLSIEDFIFLSSEEISKLKELNIERWFSYRKDGIQAVLFLGLEKSVEMFQKYHDDFINIDTLLKCRGFDRNLLSEKDELKSQMLAVPLNEMKDILYSFIKNQILTTSLMIYPTDYSLDFIKQNEDIFYTDVAIDPELRRRIYKKRLTTDDILKNALALQGLRWENFVIGPFGDLTLKMRQENVVKFIRQHREIIDQIKADDYLYHFVSNYRADQPYELALREAVKKYIFDEKKLEQYKYDENSSIPDWLKSIDFKIVRGYDNFAELLNYDEFTLLMNDGQRRCLDSLGLKNILQFERDTKKFSKEFFLISCLGDFYYYLSGDSFIKKNFYEEKIDYEQFLGVVTCFFAKKNDLSDLYELIERFREDYPDMFLENDAPKELALSFYKGDISIEMFSKYKNYLIGRAFLTDRIDKGPRSKFFSEFGQSYEQFLAYYLSEYGETSFFELLDNYGKLCSDLSKAEFTLGTSKEELEKQFRKAIYQRLATEGTLNYANLINVVEFRSEYPTLFLPKDTPSDLQEKFYNKNLDAKDLKSETLLEYFQNTDIGYGLTDALWLGGLYSELETVEANRRKIMIFNEYYRITSDIIRQNFVKYIKENEYNEEKIKNVTKLFIKLDSSNSSEIQRLKNELIGPLLEQENPEEKLDLIENVFLKNNLPTVGKVFNVFKILHPTYDSFKWEIKSPVLEKKMGNINDTIIFADLLKAQLGSNNRNLKKYLINLDEGSNLCQDLMENKRSLQDFNLEEKKIIESFFAHLKTIYNNTQSGKTVPIVKEKFTDLTEQLTFYSKIFSVQDIKEVTDRIVRMFGHYAGFDSLKQVLDYMDDIVIKTNEKNKSFRGLTLEKGDFIKGVGTVKYLGKILQNGSVCKEFLGDEAGSDYTPLDTDLSRVLATDDTLFETIGKTAADFYGPIYFVLKNDDRFIITRENSEEKEFSIMSSEFKNKLDVFETGVLGADHYGIRTAFPATAIDCIMTNYSSLPNENSKVFIEIAKSGFYVPVVDVKTEKVIFTLDQYEKYRAHMDGLSYYGINNYQLSDNLHSDNIDIICSQIDDNRTLSKKKGDIIVQAVRDTLAEAGIELKTKIDHDLTEGSAELIDTGSTGRNTNMIGDGDFDFMLRLDKKIMIDPIKLEEVKEKLLNTFGDEHRSEIINGNFRFKSVVIPLLDEPVDIDISFTTKTDNIDYSTDEALKDRLDTIKEKYPESYDLVLANILEAKKVLKDANVYKSRHNEKPQGGLGGVGVENWVLQHGGSFKDAASSFVEASLGKTFEEFSQVYEVWDFGENHLALERGQYPHDNFVFDNMDSDGYDRMKMVLANYLEKDHNKGQLNSMLEETSIKSVEVKNKNK